MSDILRNAENKLAEERERAVAKWQSETVALAAQGRPLLSVFERAAGLIRQEADNLVFYRDENVLSGGFWSTLWEGKRVVGTKRVPTTPEWSYSCPTVEAVVKAQQTLLFAIRQTYNCPTLEEVVKAGGVGSMFLTLRHHGHQHSMLLCLLPDPLPWYFTISGPKLGSLDCQKHSAEHIAENFLRSVLETGYCEVRTKAA